MFSKLLTSYLICNFIWSVFEILTRKQYRILPILQTDDLEEASNFVSESNEVSAEMCKRSLAANQALRYVNICTWCTLAVH